MVSRLRLPCFSRCAYFVSNVGFVTCLHLARGGSESCSSRLPCVQRVWSLALHSPVFASPVFVGGTSGAEPRDSIGIVTIGGRLVLIDAHIGNQVCQRRLFDFFFFHCRIFDSTLFSLAIFHSCFLSTSAWARCLPRPRSYPTLVSCSFRHIRATLSRSTLHWAARYRDALKNLVHSVLTRSITVVRRLFSFPISGVSHCLVRCAEHCNVANISAASAFFAP